MTPRDEERRKFEAWAPSEHLNTNINYGGRMYTAWFSDLPWSVKYWSERTQIAWMTWLARAEQAEAPPVDLVVTIARELYDRFVMGGWAPQDAYGQIREWLRQAEWISVASRLPERLGAFIIWHRSGYVDTWHFNPIDKFNVNHWKRNATHWQELPACPVEAAPIDYDSACLDCCAKISHEKHNYGE